MRAAAIVLFFAAASLCPGCAAGPGPRAAERRPVAVCGDLEPAAAARLLDVVDATLADVCRALELPRPAAPLHVMVFRWTWVTRAYLAGHCPTQRGAPAACWRLQDGYGIALTDYWNEAQTRRLLRHETVHYALAVNFYDLPPWLDEGLAQALGGNEGRAAPPPEHARLLRRAAARPCADEFDRLVAVPAGQKLSPAQYAWAWALTAFLLQENPAAVRRYLAEVHSGSMAVACFRRCFNTRPAALDEPLRRFLRGTK